jgi:hypothetical protein
VSSTLRTQIAYKSAILKSRRKFASPTRARIIPSWHRSVKDVYRKYRLRRGR